MTIDERIEALTESVELLHHTVTDQRKNIDLLLEHDKVQDRRFARFEAIVLRLGASHSERIRDIEKEVFGGDEPEKGKS
jgi:hypothetical protein